jgi:superfamily I DNA and RNA helicase
MDLNAEQKRIATQKPNVHQLLKGVAGSGKTSVGLGKGSNLHLTFVLNSGQTLTIG